MHREKRPRKESGSSTRKTLDEVYRVGLRVGRSESHTAHAPQQEKSPHGHRTGSASRQAKSWPCEPSPLSRSCLLVEGGVSAGCHWPSVIGFAAFAHAGVNCAAPILLIRGRSAAWAPAWGRLNRRQVAWLWWHSPHPDRPSIARQLFRVFSSLAPGHAPSRQGYDDDSLEFCGEGRVVGARYWVLMGDFLRLLGVESALPLASRPRRPDNCLALQGVWTRSLLHCCGRE